MADAPMLELDGGSVDIAGVPCSGRFTSSCPAAGGWR
jgi:hypothetical protein